MLDKEKLLELKAKAKNLEALIRIGKYGLTESIIEETDKLLEKRKLVKIKILNNCPVTDRDDMISILRKRTKSELVLTIGNVFALYRR